jgi:hypothetical protein
VTAPTAAFELSDHARVVLTARQIELAWVARVLASPVRTEPDRFDPSLRHALAPIEEHGGRVLRVVYNPAVSPIRVVTAFFNRREQRLP